MLWCLLFLVFVGFITQLIPAAGLAVILTIAVLVYAVFMEKKDETSAKPSSELPQNQLLSLVLLRLELNQQQGQMSPEVYHQLTTELDHLSAQFIKQQLYLSAQARRSLLDSAWSKLSQYMGTPLGVPPWQIVEPTQPEPTAQHPQATQVSEQPLSKAESLNPPQKPDTSVESLNPPQIEYTSIAAESSQSLTPTAMPKQETSASQTRATPKQKIPLIKRLLPSRAFIFEILLPFLWQNIGWFIGGFCFISGSIFLVTYTSGFAKTFTVVTILTLYVLMFLGGGYYLRRQRPQLITISEVLIILGILLIPLDFAATVRLIDSGFSSTPILLAIALLVAATITLMFTFATQLASGLMDRSLQGEHPWLLMSLASVQYAIPMLNVLPHWLFIASLHLTLLLILSYALWRLRHQWLRTLFIDRNKNVYYAAGTLVYTAIVAFIHLSWATDIILPAGYAGPFVMMLTLLLLSVDKELKQWVHQYVWLSHFTFVLYALSVLAILLAWQGQPDLRPPSFSAATLTLALGVILYALMIKYYLTLPPLYGLLLCLSGLYELFILQYVPYQGYFLFSLPALAALSWAQQHHATTMALMICRITLFSALGLFGWSLYQATPGIMALTTTLVALAIVRWAPSCPLNVPKPLQDYAQPILIALTLAYIPLYFSSTWSVQFSFALVGLALFWHYWGFRGRQNLVLLNSSLLALIGATGLMGYTHPQLVPGLLLLNAGILLSFSLRLRLQSFFYLMLLSLVAAGLLIKLYYFPTNSGGKTFLFLALATWMILWWLYYRLHYLALSAQAVTPQQPVQLTLLGFWKVFPGRQSLESVVKPPLENSFYLLWVLGLATLFHKAFLTHYTLTFNANWAIAALWSALITVLVAGQWRQLALLFLAVILSVAALAVWQPIELSLLIPISALGIWLLSLIMFRYRRFWVSLLGWQGCGRKQAELIIHLAALSLIILNLIITFTTLPHFLTQLYTLLVSMVFFAWSGYRYHDQRYSYGVILCFSMIILLNLDALFYHIQSAQIVLLFAVLTLGLASLAQKLSHWQTPLVSLYQRPLWHTALLFYGFSLIGSLWAHHGVGLAWSLLALTLAQFPLLRPLAQAAQIRGVSVAVLLTLAVISGCWNQIAFCLPAWSFILWIVAYYGLPRWNQRWPQWALHTDFWPWLGLALITAYFGNSVLLEGLYDWQTFGLMTLYLLLLLVHMSWQGTLAWLVALGVTLTGVLAIATLLPITYLLGLPFILASILWFNGLIYLSSLLNKDLQLKQPLLFWSWLGVHLYLALITVVTLMGLLSLGIVNVLPVMLPLLLALLVSYLLNLKSLPPAIAIHGLILVVFNTFFWLFKGMFSLPLLMTLWTASLLGYLFIQSYQHRFERHQVLSLWLMMSFILALAEWVFTETLTYDSLLILLSLTAISLIFGWISHYGKLGLAVGVVLLATSMYFIWVLVLPSKLLLPSYGFQAGVLAWLVLYLRARLSAIECADSVTQLSAWNPQRQHNVLWLFNGLIPILTVLTVAIGLLYHTVMLTTLVNDAQHVTMIPIVHLAVLATSVIWSRLWWHYAPGAESFTYGLGMIIAMIVLYLRTLLFGNLAPSVWDTALLMGCGYGLFALYQFIPSSALYRLTLLMPILALLTVPLELGSLSATLTLWAAAILYFSIPRTTTVPLYLGVLAANLGIYLWVPQWAHSYSLLQMYTLPAAITVLIMAHLHQQELKPKILYRVRLVALGTVYTSATLDVLLQQASLGVFALVLALSLAGIIIGIGLRNRAFLYSGSLFLVLNVLGQLLRFYPEDRLGKAIILMVLGGLIIGSMIGFSIQRQALIQRWQLLRADLATWY